MEWIGEGLRGKLLLCMIVSKPWTLILPTPLISLGTLRTALAAHRWTVTGSKKYGVHHLAATPRSLHSSRFAVTFVCSSFFCSRIVLVPLFALSCPCLVCLFTFLQLGIVYNVFTVVPTHM